MSYELLSLSLLVLLIRADHADDAAAAHDPALVTNPLHRRPDLHAALPIADQKVGATLV
jgi:hypothetical protein